MVRPFRPIKPFFFNFVTIWSRGRKKENTTESKKIAESYASSSAFPCSDQVPKEWLQVQDSLKKKLVIENDYKWKLDEAEESCGGVLLKYVGGVDISFSKDDPHVACGTLVVLDFKTLNVVYEDSSMVTINVPYIPGFLAFREAPIFLELLQKMKNGSHHCYPQLLMIDGNGLLHPRGFGSACHLGVLADLPTIGIGKNLHHVDGLTKSRVRELLDAEESFNMDFIPLIGNSGHTLGAAVQSISGSFKPIFISVGHRVSLAAAVDIAKRTCKFRVPEPIRQADIRSRDYLRKHHCIS